MTLEQAWQMSIPATYATNARVVRPDRSPRLPGHDPFEGIEVAAELRRKEREELNRIQTVKYRPEATRTQAATAARKAMTAARRARVLEFLKERVGWTETTDIRCGTGLTPDECWSDMTALRNARKVEWRKLQGRTTWHYEYRFCV